MAGRPPLPYKHANRKRVRRHRRVDYTDAIKQIYRGFIKPFALRWAGERWQSRSITTAASYFFNAPVRSVDWCVAKHAFKMPGALKNSRQRVDRHIKKGDPVIVRRDERTPDVVEVTLGEDTILILTNPQYVSIKDHLKVVI